jgi:hypothetical protein
MLKCYLTNIRTGEQKYLSDRPISVHDDNEFTITLEITGHDVAIKPVVSIGDIEIDVKFRSQLDDQTVIYRSEEKSFFDNAFFLNYFGECELFIAAGNMRKGYIVEVNVNGYKANIAKEMLTYLSKNAEDVLQTCYSKSHSSFSHKRGKQRNIVKLTVLTQTVESIERLLGSFKVDYKYNIQHKVQFNSNKPAIVDDTTALWLTDNLDALEAANSSQYLLKINKKHYQVNIPNSVIHFDSDLKENRALHQFILVARKYLNDLRNEIEKQTLGLTEKVEYSEYVKFDQVIKGMINPILSLKIKAIDHLLSRIGRISLFFKKYIPVNKIRGEMPIQTSYTLRHRHYGIAFNSIATFYEASDADKSNSDFLLGLRNLSQLFELCCLYYLVSFLKKVSDQVGASWVSNSFEWNGQSTDKLNVLANEFLFENEYHKYTLLYEKKFYSLSKDTINEQEGNLVRVDQTKNYYEPDFTIKVLNKATNEYHFIILDAKFSRGYKMKKSKSNEAPSVLQTVFNKYATNLQAYKEGSIVNLTRYVGILFGLSKQEKEQRRINMFSKIHDIDGLAPLFPYAAADFISFSESNESIESIDNIMRKYL